MSILIRFYSLLCSTILLSRRAILYYLQLFCMRFYNIHKQIILLRYYSIYHFELTFVTAVIIQYSYTHFILCNINQFVSRGSQKCKSHFIICLWNFFILACLLLFYSIFIETIFGLTCETYFGSIKFGQPKSTHFFFL